MHKQFSKDDLGGGVVWSHYWRPSKKMRSIGTPVVRNGYKLFAYTAGSSRVRYYHLTNCYMCGGGYLTSRWDSNFCSDLCRKAHSRIGI